MGFASISTDLYLPAMPAMGRALGADAGTVELTVSGYLIGFSLGQLLWGPIGDRYGRRGPVAIGLVLFVIGSAGCALAGSAGAMIGWRVVQAVGACAGVVLARAMVRDLYAGARAAQMLSTLMTVMAVAPLLGPIVGGQILGLAGWRAIFWTLVGVGQPRWQRSFTLPETLPPERRNREPLGRAHRDLWRALRQRRLIGYAAAGGFFYAGMFAYVAGTPFAYISYHHVPPQLYGLLFGTGIVGIMAANLINARLVMRLGSDAAAAGGDGRSGAGGRTARRQRTNGLGRLGGACRAVVPVCRHGRLHHCELDRGRARELSGPGRCGIGPGRLDPLRRGDRRLGAGRGFRRWHAVAAGLGGRGGRARRALVRVAGHPAARTCHGFLLTQTFLRRIVIARPAQPVKARCPTMSTSSLQATPLSWRSQNVGSHGGS